MVNIKNTLFWKKLTAVLGIFAIINSMIVAVPTAFAAPEASNPANAVYMPDNVQAGNVSTITATFTEVLTDENGINGDGDCGLGVPPGSYCYDTSNIALQGGVWGAATVTKLVRESSDNAKLTLIFDSNGGGSGVITGPGGTIEVSSGIGGIVSPQTFTPVQVGGGGLSADTATYMPNYFGTQTMLYLLFTGGNIDDTAGTQACVSNNAKKCLSDLGNVTIDTGLAAGSVTEAMIDPTGNDANSLGILINATDALADYTATTVTITAGVLGLAEDAVFSAPLLPFNPGPEASSALYTADNGSGKSQIVATFTDDLDPTSDTEACAFDAQKKCLLDPGNVVVTGLADGKTVAAVVIGAGGLTTATILLSGTGGLSNYATASFTFAAVAGVQSEQTFSTITVPAVDPISSVTAVDDDDTFPELDGNDFTISWTNASQSTPAGFVENKIYIVPNATSLTASNVATNGCGGGVCTAMNIFPLDVWNFTNVAIPPSAQADSVGTAWDENTAYKVCVVTTADTDSITCSSSFNVVSDVVADDDAPFIGFATDHTMVDNGSNDVVIYASIDDSQTTASQFNNTGDAGNEYFKLKYYAGGNWDSVINAVQVNGNLFKFTIPYADIPATEFKYYITAQDADSNATVLCGDYSSFTDVACQNSPFVANVISGDATVSLSGTVRDFNDNLIEGATIVPGGLAAPEAVATSAANGTYTITGIPTLNAYDVTAYKSGYCDNARFEIVGESNKTGIDISINAGDCFFDPNQAGGSGDKPFIISTNLDGWNVDPSVLIWIQMSKGMDTSTIIDGNTADAGSNIYLTTDDGSTKISGATKYCENSQGAAAVCSSLEDWMSNVIIFSPAADLTPGTNYTLVITGAVLGSGGKNIDGGRPGGGFERSFSVGNGALSENDISTTFGQCGACMPPYVEAMVPQPERTVPNNTTISIQFNQSINSSTITSSSVQLLDANDQVVSTTKTLSVDGKRLTITPVSSLSAGKHTLNLKGSIANVNGFALLPPENSSDIAFYGDLYVEDSSDVTAPTVYPFVADGGTIAVSEPLRFGFSEAMDASTLDFLSGGITLKRGNLNIASTTVYDPGSFELTIQPNDVLPPNTAVTLSFINPTVKDLAGVSMASGNVFNYTTGGIDTDSPATNGGSGCDDYKCRVSFTEPMNHDSQVGAGYANSVLKPANFNLVVGGDTINLAASGVTFVYQDNGVEINGLSLANYIGDDFVMTVTGVQDLSGNSISTSNSENVVRGVVKNSSETFGSFGGGGSMFGTPTVGMAMDLNEQIGGFSIADIVGGNATIVNPENKMAGVDADIVHVMFSPGVALLDGDQVTITFPTGTVVANTIPDAWSPFNADFNQSWGSGTVTFDNTFDTDGISVNSSQRKVTVQLDVTGSTGANDSYTIDLKKIVNPTIPKDPSTSGYTAGVKVLRSGAEIFSQTSMPFFIEAAGTNTITVSVCAGSCGSPDNVAGDVYLWGGGGRGMSINKKATLASGAVSKIDDESAGSLSLESLPDGCYFIGTEPIVTLGGNDYFSPQGEDVCVSGGETVVKNLELTSASSSANAPVTVKFAGLADFEGADIDIFAGGPGNFVVKTLTGVNAPDPDGYTLRLPSNGSWFIGVGPGMPKGTAAMTAPVSLPGTPPPNVEVKVSNIDSTPVLKIGQLPPNGVTWDEETSTITFTFAAADKAISGTVKDGSGNAIANVDVMIMSQGFSAPVFTQTAKDGTFTGYVSDYGSYVIQANKWGLPSVEGQIEIKPDSNDVDSLPDMYFKGKQITNANPFVIKMKKAAYSIAGKVFDSNGNAISYAPVRATADGAVVYGGTDSTGNYTVFVDSGTWTLTSESSSQTEECGTWTKTVTITSSSKSSQNIEPSSGTCYTLSGTITVAGAAYQGPVMIQSWDLINDVPAGGVFKPTSTNSSGVYQAKVPGNTDLKIFTWDPSYGELSATVSVATSNATKNITTGSASPITLTVTGGTSDMKGSIEFENITSGARKMENLQDFSAAHTINLLDGSYKYRMQLDGVGEYSGTVAGGGEITVDASAVSRYTYSGTVVDGDSNALSNVAVTFNNASSQIVRTAITDANGAYSIKLRSGTWDVSAGRAGYIPSQRSTILLTADSASNAITLPQAASTLEGTVYKSDGSTPADSGFVTATEATSGAKITVPVDVTDGSYSVPVTDGSWTVEAGAPLHAKTTIASAVTVSGVGANTDIDGTMTADSSKAPLSAVKQLSAVSGGVVDDTGNTGVKIVADPGAFTTGNTDVNVTIEKSYQSGDTTNYDTFGGVGFDFKVSDGSQSYTNFNNNLTIQVSYADALASLPADATEDDLDLKYWSPDKGEYVSVEGGCVKDTTNNLITCNTSHFTTFAFVVPASSSASSNSIGGGSRAKYATDEVAVVDGEEVVEGGDATVEEEQVDVVEEEKTYTEVDEEAGTVTYLVPPSDTYEVTFTDMVNHWSEEIISDLAGRGIIEGYTVNDHTEFKPDKGMTRAELVKAIVRAMELPVPLDVTAADLGYYDVRSDSLYAPYIYAAQKAGIVDRAATFRPNAVVNRAEALKIILLGANVDLMDYPDGMLLPFGDVARDAWFRNNLKYAFFHGIIGGYNVDGKKEFRGANNVTRAEASKMISKVFSFEDEISLSDMLKTSFFGMFR